MYCKYCGKLIDDDSVFCRFCGKRQSEEPNTQNKPIRQEPPHNNNQERIRPVDYQAAHDAQLYGVNAFLPEEETIEEEHNDVGKPVHRIEYLNEGYEYNATYPPPSKENAQIANGIVISGKTILKLLLITLAVMAFFIFNYLFYLIAKNGGEAEAIKSYFSEIWDMKYVFLLISLITVIVFYLIRWGIKGVKWVNKNRTI